MKMQKALIILAAGSIAAPFAQAKNDSKKDKSHDDRPSSSQQWNSQGQDKYQQAFRARSLEGNDLARENGESVGTIDDFVISADSGKIDGVIAGTGFLGIGGSQKLVKWSDIQTNSSGDFVSKADMSDDKSNFNVSDLERDYNRKDDVKSGQLRAMSYLNSDVESQSGAHLGELHDWIITADQGRASYAIVRQLDPINETEWDYFAVSTDLLAGTRNGEVVFNIDYSDFGKAEYIDDQTRLTTSDSGRGVFKVRTSNADMARANR